MIGEAFEYTNIIANFQAKSPTFNPLIVTQVFDDTERPKDLGRYQGLGGNWLPAM